MSLETQIQSDLKAAMLAKDEAALRALRAIKSAILLAKTSGAGGELSAEDELKMLQKLVKQRKESIEIYEKQGRDDLAKNEKEEVAVIEKFLPAQMSEADVRAEVKKIIESTGAKSAAEMGKVMGVASKQLAGKADNKMVAAIVKELLSQ
ncbi:MAG TPA: GatB/YqeY domain-containing protein [Bacteroidia bacterium]|nr:GatB/YqeY domain-containing protein [Bacteroidia bacterium]